MGFRVNGQGAAAGASLSDATPQPTGSAVTATAGTAEEAARADHVHETSVAAADLTDAGATGVDLAQAATAAEARAVLGAYATLPDSGWTATISGTATAARSGGVTTMTADSNGAVRYYYPSILDPQCPAIDVIGRFDFTSGAPATAAWCGICVSNTDDTKSFVAQVDETGYVRLYVNSGSGYSSAAASAAPVSLTSGEVWMRLVVTPAGVAMAYHGTGSGSTPPTSWTYIGYTQSVAAIVGGALTHVSTRAGRTASGSGTYTVTVSDLQTRTPGLAP